MKLLKACFLLSLSSSLAMPDGEADYGPILAAGEGQFSSEEFLYEEEYSSFEDVMMQDHSNLRGRDLQALQPGMCRTTSLDQRSISVCGGTTGITCTSAMTSPSYCSSRTSYPCMCIGSTAMVSCGYCQLQTSNGVFCQVTGSSNTFTHSTLGVRTCSCEYRNGAAQQTCYSAPTSAPVPTTMSHNHGTMPTTTVMAPYPHVMPNMTPNMAPYPHVMPTAMATTPRPTPRPTRRPTPRPTPRPVVTPAMPYPRPPSTTTTTGAMPVPHAMPTRSPSIAGLTTAGCRSISQRNVTMCSEAGKASNYCDSMPTTLCNDNLLPYACSCSALNPSSTTCHFCQVQTVNSIVCQVTGTNFTFTAPDFTTRTCSCEAIGWDSIRQYCTTSMNTVAQGTSGMVGMP